MGKTAVPGKWNIFGINIPDRGWTEERTTWQSNPLAVQTFGTPSSSGQTAPMSYGGQTVNGYTNYSLGPNTSRTLSTTQTPDYTKVLGAKDTYNPGGGSLSSGGGTSTSNDINPFDTAAAAADSQRQAQIAASNAAYDRTGSLLSGQLTDVGNQKTSAMADLEMALNNIGKKVGEQKLSSQEMTNQGINQAGSTARNTQMSNRNVLRALGILNSSYAADKLQAPMQAFDEQRATLVKTNIDNINKLDEYYNTQQAAHQKAVADLNTQYASLVDKINTDIRFNDQQRNAGVLAAQSAFDTQLSNIVQSFANIKSNVDTAKTNFASQIAAIQLNANPTANLSGIMNTAMNTANQVYAPQQSSMTLSEQTRKQLLGLGQ